MPRPKISEEKQNLIVKYTEAGMSCHDIGNLIGVSHQTVCHYQHKFKIGRQRNFKLSEVKKIFNEASEEYEYWRGELDKGWTSTAAVIAAQYCGIMAGMAGLYAESTGDNCLVKRLIEIKIRLFESDYKKEN